MSAQSSKGEKGEREFKEFNGSAVRYFVNIGSRDDFDWMSLKDFLRDTLELGKEDVYKVDVKEGFSFFNTDPEHTDKVMETLNNITLEGRRINVEISKNDGGGRRDHNNRHGERGGFKSGGFKGDRGSRDGGFRSDRGDRGSRDGGGFSGKRRSEGFSSDRPARRSEGFSERAPRRSESFGDQSRPKRPRKG